MTADIAHRITMAAADLRRTHPDALALELLDLLLQSEGVGNGLSFSSQLVHPGSPFGQLIAEAFDHGMSPQEWQDWTVPGADPKLAEALMPIWQTYVLPRFESRYGSKIL